MILSYFGSFADSTSVNWEIGFRSGIGGIWAHKSQADNYSSTQIQSHELILAKIPNGSEKWHHRFNFTKNGIIVSYSNFINDELGKSISVIPYYDFNWIRKKRFWGTLRVGIGLGYISKKYDAITNDENLLIGNHFNASFDIGLNLDYSLTNKVVLSGGVSLGHLSNGKYAAPNLGINYPKFLLGLKYQKNRNELVQNNDKFGNKLNNRHSFSINTNAGAKQNSAADENKYLTTNLSLGWQYRAAYKSSWGVSVDFIHDSGKMVLWRKKTGDPSKSTLSYTSVGLGPNYQFMIHHTTLYFQVGLYLLNGDVMDGTIYNRVGVRQKLTGDLFFHAGLRNHKVTAQTAEFGLVYFIK